MQPVLTGSTTPLVPEGEASASAPAVDRRHALLGLAAAPLAIVGGRAEPVAAGASSPGLDPHHAWLEEWRVLLAWCNGPGPGARDVQEFPQWHRLLELEDLIGDTPSATLAGAMTQLRFAAESIDEYHTLEERGLEAFERGLETLERLLAGEAAHA